jgi:hypothetical protein
MRVRLGGTGFSREGASAGALDFAVRLLTLSRLKPVLHVRVRLGGTGFGREGASAGALDFAVRY